MALTDYVLVNITQTSVGLARAGFGVPLIISETATWLERVRLYGGIADVAADFPDTTSPEYLSASAMFAQTPHPVTVMIGRSALPSTQQYVISVEGVASLTPYSINVLGKGVTPTTATYTTQPDIVGTLLPRTSSTLTSRPTACRLATARTA